MPSIKLIKISKDINVGVASIEEFLEKKGIANAKGPNSRISPDVAVECLKELGKSLSEQDKKRLIALYTADPKSSKKASESVSTSAPKETKTPTEQVKGTKEKLVKVEVPEELKPSLETKGFIDLDKFNKGSASKKVTKKAEEVSAKVSSVSESEARPSKKEETVASKELKTEKTELTTGAKKDETLAAKESVKESPKETEKKSVETDKMPEEASRVESKKIKEDISKEKVKKDRSVSDAKPSSSEATQSSKLGESSKSSEKAETKAAEKSGAKEDDKNAEKSILSSAEKESDEKVFRLDHEDEDKPGLKILGKIDLSTVDTSTTASRRKRKKAAEGERKKRKRINKQKVDISKEGSAKDGRGRDGKSKRTSDRKKGGDNQPKVGRKQKRSAAKKEVSQEEIQKQIKETLQQMQNQKRRGSTAAKYRKDKRDAHRREQDEMDRASEDNKTLRLTEYVTANDLSSMMEVPVNDIISLCFNMGIMVSINQRLDKDTIDLILEEYGFVPEYVGMEMIEAITDQEEDKEEDLLPRAPIVTVMGHVDHGKTSLLDNIRSTNVIAGEAGGITQHVGAYSVSLKDGRKITFLDTPGHEAFTAMRARGAKVTDIVIVVIAADDGVKPQTVEAINHASIAGVPIVFAINKIDRQEANPDKIKEELANLNYLVEDWGGKYQSQNISAKGNIGIEELLEKVLLEAELLDLKANPNKKALGTVIESTLEHGRGYTTKVLVREGTLHVGDHILSGIYHGRVKALFNERGQNVDEVGPATPVKVLGLNGAAQAGDAVNVMDSEQEARDIASKREQLQREQKERMHKIPTLQSLGERIKEGNIQELNVIVKGDVDGSVEALSGSIEKLSTDKVRVRVIHKAVGQISDSDVVLAAASDAVIIGFQVRPSGSAKKIAENEGVEIRTYSVIYTALDEVKAAMEGMLEPEFEETVVANLEVRETFNISKVGTIAGCIVKEGKVSRNSNVRLIRDGIVIYTGHLASLKRFKDDVKEVGNGYECGLNLENFNDIAVGDLIEAYEEVEVKKKL